ncbi:hypothetical protein F4809DRAFT_147275 [Biscogniauxia mediterranea]|nr:hypothetical protein F4809DRAFT_147275 [Biscogniauxia mediterranea]
MPLHLVALRAAALGYYFAFGSVGDLLLLTGWFLWKRLAHVTQYLQSGNAQMTIPAIVIASFTIAILGYFRRYHKKRHISTSVWQGPGRPLLFPCQTTHTRLFPKKHSFVYSYLLVGVPVGWSGVAGDMISADVADGVKKGWYNINAADYLERGRGHIGLRGKLDEYLQSQGIDASQYPYAYLVTAAKFLGYHFNPVSFWYLYSADKQLEATILEVNNTFDERRMYFLTPNDDNVGFEKEVSGKDPDLDAPNPSDTSIPKPLKQKWPKDFHVSPFNSRKGAYSLVAHHPLHSGMEGRGPIDSTITLISSKGNAKLVARVFSDGDAIDPTEMTLFHQIKFLSRWWWVGFATFPRIVKEAAVLFFQRKLHVWYRPEPLKESMGRRADNAEKQLEPIFRRYLKYLVHQSPTPLVVRYIPSGIDNAPVEEFVSATVDTDRSSAESLELKVLTPVFYVRFIYYAHDFEAMFSELNDNCTISVSNPTLLPKLVFKRPPPPLHTASYVDYGYFTAIKNLRRRPERIERPLTSSQVTATQSSKDIRVFRLSAMDGYVLSHEDAKTRRLYRHLVLKLFVADRIALGSMDVLGLESLIFRILLAWAVLP